MMLVYDNWIWCWFSILKIIKNYIIINTNKYISTYKLTKVIHLSINIET